MAYTVNDKFCQLIIAMFPNTEYYPRLYYIYVYMYVTILSLSHPTIGLSCMACRPFCRAKRAKVPQMKAWFLGASWPRQHTSEGLHLYAFKLILMMSFRNSAICLSVSKCYTQNLFIAHLSNRGSSESC